MTGTGGGAEDLYDGGYRRASATVTRTKDTVLNFALKKGYPGG